MAQNFGVPVVDLEGFFSGGEEGKMRVAKEIGYACENIGFFAIINHKVPKEVVAKAWEASKKFFDLSVEDKNEVAMTKKYPYGYCGFGGEVLAKSAQNMIAPGDLKESFQICVGPEVPEGVTVPGLVKPQWPSKVPEFKEALTAYYRAMENLSGELLQLFALALQLPEYWFHDKIDKHLSALRALNYPHQETPPKPGEIRASAHTDYGSLTILRQDDAPGGLQVLNKKNEWQDIGFLEDCFIINLGDLMAQWTNDRWVSTVHRVVNPPVVVNRSTRRQSMAFFHNLNNDALVQCIKTCQSKDNPSKYPSVTAGEWLMRKHHRAIGS